MSMYNHADGAVQFPATRVYNAPGQGCTTAATYSNCEALEAALSDAGVSIANRMQVGPTIGAHVGPGVYGVMYVKK